MGSFDNAICGHNITTMQVILFHIPSKRNNSKSCHFLEPIKHDISGKITQDYEQKAISTWRIIYWLIINRNNIDALSPGQIEILDAVSTLIKVDKQHTCTFENKQISSYYKKRKTGISFSLLCDFFSLSFFPYFCIFMRK